MLSQSYKHSKMIFKSLNNLREDVKTESKAFHSADRAVIRKMHVGISHLVQAGSAWCTSGAVLGHLFAEHGRMPGVLPPPICREHVGGHHPSPRFAAFPSHRRCSCAFCNVSEIHLNICSFHQKLWELFTSMS